MIRLCTHCKKADTEDPDFKYCDTCLVKLRNWLDDKAHTEPPSVIPNKADTGAGKLIEQDMVRKLHHGRKGDN